MKSNSGLQKNVCPSCGKNLEQFLVKPVFSGNGNHLQAVNVACPHCGVGADIEIVELTQSLVRQVAQPLK